MQGISSALASANFTCVLRWAITSSQPWGWLPMSVRFQVEDTHSDLVLRHPGVAFKFWHRDDCDRDNEDRVVLESASDN